MRFCSCSGGIANNVFAIAASTQFLLPTPLVFSLTCIWTKGLFSNVIRNELSINCGKNLIRARLTKMLNSLSSLIINGMPVVPTLDNNKSPLHGWQRWDNSLCSSSEINFVLVKDNLPVLISFTERKGIPLWVYFGVEWVPSVSCQYMLENLHHSQLLGRSNGITSSIHLTSPVAVNFS